MYSRTSLTFSTFCLFQLRLSDVGDELQVSAVFSKTLQHPLSSELPPLTFSDKKLVSILTLDPRLKTFAYRLLAPANVAGSHYYYIIASCPGSGSYL